MFSTSLLNKIKEVTFPVSKLQKIIKEQNFNSILKIPELKSHPIIKSIINKNNMKQEEDFWQVLTLLIAYLIPNKQEHNWLASILSNMLVRYQDFIHIDTKTIDTITHLYIQLGSVHIAHSLDPKSISYIKLKEYSMLLLISPYIDLCNESQYTKEKKYYYEKAKKLFQSLININSTLDINTCVMVLDIQRKLNLLDNSINKSLLNNKKLTNVSIKINIDPIHLSFRELTEYDPDIIKTIKQILTLQSEKLTRQVAFKLHESFLLLAYYTNISRYKEFKRYAIIADYYKTLTDFTKKHLPVFCENMPDDQLPAPAQIPNNLIQPLQTIIKNYLELIKYSSTTTIDNTKLYQIKNELISIKIMYNTLDSPYLKLIDELINNINNFKPNIIKDHLLPIRMPQTSLKILKNKIDSNTMIQDILSSHEFRFKDVDDTNENSFASTLESKLIIACSQFISENKEDLYYLKRITTSIYNTLLDDINDPPTIKILTFKIALSCFDIGFTHDFSKILLEGYNKDRFFNQDLTAITNESELINKLKTLTLNRLAICYLQLIETAVKQKNNIITIQNKYILALKYLQQINHSNTPLYLTILNDSLCLELILSERYNLFLKDHKPTSNNDLFNSLVKKPVSIHMNSNEIKKVFDTIKSQKKSIVPLNQLISIKNDIDATTTNDILDKPERKIIVELIITYKKLPIENITYAKEIASELSYLYHLLAVSFGLMYIKEFRSCMHLSNFYADANNIGKHPKSHIIESSFTNEEIMPSLPRKLIIELNDVINKFISARNNSDHNIKIKTLDLLLVRLEKLLHNQNIVGSYKDIISKMIQYIQKTLEKKFGDTNDKLTSGEQKKRVNMINKILQSNNNPSSVNFHNINVSLDHNQSSKQITEANRLKDLIQSHITTIKSLDNNNIIALNKAKQFITGSHSSLSNKLKFDKTISQELIRYLSKVENRLSEYLITIRDELSKYHTSSVNITFLQAELHRLYANIKKNIDTLDANTNNKYYDHYKNQYVIDKHRIANVKSILDSNDAIKLSSLTYDDLGAFERINETCDVTVKKIKQNIRKFKKAKKTETSTVPITNESNENNTDISLTTKSITVSPSPITITIKPATFTAADTIQSSTNILKADNNKSRSMIVEIIPNNDKTKKSDSAVTPIVTMTHSFFNNDSKLTPPQTSIFTADNQLILSDHAKQSTLSYSLNSIYDVKSSHNQNLLFNCLNNAAHNILELNYALQNKDVNQMYFNILRIVLSIKLYLTRGGVFDAKFKVNLEQYQDFRNLLCHFINEFMNSKNQLNDTSLTAQQFLKSFSIILTNSPFANIASAEKLETLKKQYPTDDPIVITETVLYKTLSKFLDQRLSNNLNTHACSRIVLFNYIPRIIELNSTLTASNLYKLYNLVIACGELKDHILITDQPILNKFLIECKNLRNDFAHLAFFNKQKIKMKIDKIYVLAVELTQEAEKTIIFKP